MDDLTTVISRVRAGEREAYADIVTRFQEMAVGYANVLLGDRHLAEDAAQEAFLQAYVSLPQLREAAAFPGWFKRIVHKHCDRIRRHRRLHLVPLAQDQWEARVEPAGTLEAQDQREMLERAIRRLPEGERAPITLYYMRQYSHAEMAAFLEIPETTVNNRMHSARKHLKKELLEMAEQERARTPAPDRAFTGRVLEQIEAMSSLHGALAEPIRATLAESLSTEVTVRVISVDHKMGLKVLQEFPCPCCTYSFQPEGSQRRICFDIHMELAACMIGRELGRGDDIRVVDVGQIGQDELGRISPFAGRIMSHVVALWRDVVAMEIIEPEVETNPVYVMDSWIAAHDPMFHVRFEVSWDGRTSKIDLCYPAPSLAAGLARLQNSAAR